MSYDELIKLYYQMEGQFTVGITKFTVMLLLLSILIPSAFSQIPREVTVGPGKDKNKSFPFRDKYRFSSFQDGYFITKEGRKSQKVKFNFNLVSEKPQFIDSKGDTLFLTKETAQLVKMNDVTYFNDADTYYEIVLDNSHVKLAIVREWSLRRVETVYNDPRTGASSISLGRSGHNAIYSPEHSRMIRNENNIYNRDSSYYFIGKKGEVFKASQKNFTRLHKRNKLAIESYIDRNDINFKKEEDLKRLIEFSVNIKAEP